MKIISVNKVTFLKDIDIYKKVKYLDKFRYFDGLDLENGKIRQFLFSLDDLSLYTVIPFITISGKLDNPYLILSRQILVSMNSNPIIIHNYIFNQLAIALDDFNIDNLNSYSIYFKYRKVSVV